MTEQPIPDDKDWTWVLERPCPECGFDAAAHPRDQVGADLRANARQWPVLLDNSLATVRPEPRTWSALEYGCHVRDVFGLFLHRLNLMLDTDGAAFPNWDQDATAVDERYDRQDPQRVAADLLAAGLELGDAFDALDDRQWQHRGVRSDGARFTVDTFARYLVHDPVHHVWDVEQGYARLG